jgi:hypothetical protein
MIGLLVKYRSRRTENARLPAIIGGHGKSLAGGELHVTGTTAMLQWLPRVSTDAERFLSLLRSSPLLTHANAVKALWGESANGGPLYAQNILATYVSRLRRAGHSIENYPGVGYRLRELAGGHGGRVGRQ